MKEGFKQKENIIYIIKERIFKLGNLSGARQNIVMTMLAYIRFEKRLCFKINRFSYGTKKFSGNLKIISIALRKSQLRSHLLTTRCSKKYTVTKNLGVVVLKLNVSDKGATSYVFQKIFFGYRSIRFKIITLCLICVLHD